MYSIEELDFSMDSGVASVFGKVSSMQPVVRTVKDTAQRAPRSLMMLLFIFIVSF